MLRSLRVGFFATLLSLGAVLGVPAPAAIADSPAAKTDFEGVYRLVAADAKKKEIRGIVDTATEDMNALIRDYARRRLYETTEPLAVMVLRFPADKIFVGYFGENALVSPDDGRRVKWTNRLGDKTTASQTFGNGMLVQHLSGASGGKRKTTFRLSEDGTRVTLRTTITATLLPHAVKFTTTYVRK